MESKYLPIGTVVLLNNSKKFMIIGYYSINYKNSVKMYDYLGCSYPEGMLLISDLESFNHEDIEQVLFYGYSDESYNKLNENMNGQLANNYENLNKDKFSNNISKTDDGVVVYDSSKESLIDPIYDILSEIEVINPFKREETSESSVAELPKVDIVNETVTSDKLFTIEEPAEETESQEQEKTQE